MHPIVFLPVFIVLLIVISNCVNSKGSIAVLDNPDGTGFTAEYKKWSAKQAYELPLEKGDVLQVQAISKEGEIAFSISGKNGSSPYMGNLCESMLFTVTVYETDTYAIQFSGKTATGKLTVKNVSGAG